MLDMVPTRPTTSKSNNDLFCGNHSTNSCKQPRLKAEKKTDAVPAQTGKPGDGKTKVDDFNFDDKGQK